MVYFQKKFYFFFIIISVWLGYVQDQSDVFFWLE